MAWHYLLNFSPACWMIACSTKATTLLVHRPTGFLLFFSHWDFSSYCQCLWARGFPCSIPNQVVSSGGKGTHFSWLILTWENCQAWGEAGNEQVQAVTPPTPQHSYPCGSQDSKMAPWSLIPGDYTLCNPLI